jgi:tetratricopeptide (TPR) repeat protein
MSSSDLLTSPAPDAASAPCGPAVVPAASWLQWLLLLWTAAFAFLLASFPARNSDLWLHLAAGQQLMQGTGSFSPHWLYDLLVYGLYTAVGGTGLVLLKALLAVGMALLLLRLCQTGPPWWVAVVCTALAVLAMSTRLLLQPAILSYFFLALTVWMLRDSPGANATRLAPPGAYAPGSPGRFRLAGPLLVLFVLWANVDGAFVVGLGLVALVWLGRSLDEGGSGFLGRVCAFAVLTAACLLNPSHVYVFTSHSTWAWLGWEQGTSPLGSAYLGQVGASPAALAYYPLLGLGLLSFALNLPRWPWRWFLPWLALAVLSVCRVRVVPFFAVVAGPVLAWQLQQFFARRPATIDSRQETGGSNARLLAIASCFLPPASCLLLTAFLACAWPGWLQAPPYEPRRWAIEVPSSVKRGALETAQWHRDGKLGPEARGLHLSAVTLRAFAWLCPQDKGVLDAGLADAIRGAAEAPGNWRGRLRKLGVNHIIVYDTDGGRLFAALTRLLTDPEQWPLLYLEGNLAVFGWRDPARPGSAELFRGLRLDFDRLAFHPSKKEEAPRRASTQEPEPRTWWEAFVKPIPPPPVDRDEASLYLLYAEALRQTAPRRYLIAWRAAETAGLVGAAGSWASPGRSFGPGWLLDVRWRFALIQPQPPDKAAGLDSVPVPDYVALAFVQRFLMQKDQTPPALLYLAIRAARRALADNPRDARTYLVLGECYLLLLHHTREWSWAQRAPQLGQLRRAQASAALNQVLALKPDLAHAVQAHLDLSWLYREMGYEDLVLKHLRAFRESAQKAGPPPGVTAEQFRAQQAGVDQELHKLAAALDEREKRYAAEAKGRRPVDRAALAFKLGLAGRARDLLLSSDIAAFGPPGMALELELLLGTGRARDVWQWTGLEKQREAQQKDLGPARYHWLRAQALAATGDYALAQEELRRLAPGGPTRAASAPGRVVATLLGRQLLDEQPFGVALPALAWRAVLRAEFASAVAGVAQGLRQEADARVLRGLLALEQGDVAEAKAAFRLALAAWKDQAAADSGAGLDFNSRPLAQSYLERLK